MATRASGAPAPPLLEIDLGDAAVIVREHTDGMFTIDLNDERLIVNAEQMQEIVTGFTAIGRGKGWIAEADGS